MYRGNALENSFDTQYLLIAFIKALINKVERIQKREIYLYKEMFHEFAK